MTKPTPLSLQELIAMLKQEEVDASSYAGSDLAKAQEQALDRFYSRPYGDEVEGRSRVVSGDLRDTILWLMPDLMRPFRHVDELVSVLASSQEDDAPEIEGKSRVDLMAAYLAHVAFRDNDGMTVAHDFAFDGLLQRIGWLRVAWEDAEPKPPKMIEGLQGDALQKYASDPEYEVLGQEETEPGVFTLQLRHKPKMGRVHIEAVPPEEMAISRGAKSVPDAAYHRRKRKVFVADLARKHPDQADALWGRKPRSDEDLAGDARALSRQSNNSAPPTEPTSTRGRERCDLCEEFIRVDFDGDGIVELRHVKRVDDIVLFNEAVDASEFVRWTPFRISHKIDGLSMHDVLADLQKIRTVITRAFLDGLGQTLTPTKYVNLQKISEEHGTLAAVQRNDVGGIIPVNGDPREAVMDAVAPDVSAPAIQALEHFDQRAQEASGVTRQAQGMDPQAMNKTATGIDLLQAAAKTRVEMIATWLGKSIEEALSLVLKMLVAHQDGIRQVKLFGQWVPVDPRTWNDEASISVHVGAAGVSRNQRLMNLGMIAQKQEQVLATAGQGQPIVTLQHYRTTLAQMVGTMGFKDAAQFVGEIPPDWQPPEPPPDPKQQEAQAKLQIEQTKMQFDQERQQAEFQHKVQLERMKLESEEQLAQLRIESEEQLALMRMQFEQRLAERRLEAEMAMAGRKQDGSDGGFRPGGKLDA